METNSSECVIAGKMGLRIDAACKKMYVWKAFAMTLDNKLSFYSGRNGKNVLIQGCSLCASVHSSLTMKYVLFVCFLPFFAEPLIYS